MKTPPTNPFFATRSQVVDLARRRYFEDGVPPAGVISEAVFQSWARCQRLHDRPERQVEFQPVTQSRALFALQRNRRLHNAWQAEVPSLQRLLGTTSCAAMLTDGTGVLIGAACAGRPHENLMPVATRLGVNLSEEAVGTTAPGIVVHTGQPVCVFGSEHYFEHVRQMHCAAAPIRDIHGSLAGVLDISSESIAFGFDAASVVGHLACTIENRLLVAQSTEHLILRIQVAPALLDSSAVGMVGIQPDGRVAWINGVASRLLGVREIDRTLELPLAESVLGASFACLASMPRDGAAVLSLPNGLSLWARAELRGRQGSQAPFQTPVRELPAAAANPVLPHKSCAPMDAAMATKPRADPALPQTVETTHEELMRKALRESGGNLSKAARRLGVSRGWIYRRMQTPPSARRDEPESALS
jgi:transcriptional regulator of acetoin/glycerol metabolism